MKILKIGKLFWYNYSKKKSEDAMGNYTDAPFLIGFTGLQENLKECHEIPFAVREAWAADFRRHLSEARENTARR